MTALTAGQLHDRLAAAEVQDADLASSLARRDGAYHSAGHYMIRYHATADRYTLAVYR